MTPQQAIDAARAAGDAAKSRDPMTGSIVDAVVADIVARLEALGPARTFARHRWDERPRSRVLPATCGECEHYDMGECGKIAYGMGGSVRFPDDAPPSFCPLRKGYA